MKFIYTVAFALLFSGSFLAQKNAAVAKKDQQIASTFQKNYKKKNYKKFDGKIFVNETFVAFDDKNISFEKSDAFSINILKKGLIYPQLLTDFQIDKFLDETTDRTQLKFFKLQKDPRAAFDVNNISVKISELGFLNSSEKSRRYKMISKSRNLPNAIIYYFELTNSKANKNTSSTDFLKDAKLTFLMQEKV